MFIDIHTHNTSTNHNNKSIFCIDIYKDINSQIRKFSSIGIHPWFINDTTNINIIENNINNKNIIAIGEIGLDKTIDINLDLQKELLFQQLNLAEQNNKPVIIHCVKAYSDFQQIIKDYSIPFIFHGFNSSLQTAKSLIENGAYLSFGKHLLTNRKLQNILKNIDLSKMFFETDDSEISINEIYLFAAKLLNIKINDLQKRIEMNFKEVWKHL
jgi:TatD DNase family protein